VVHLRKMCDLGRRHSPARRQGQDQPPRKLQPPSEGRTPTATAYRAAVTLHKDAPRQRAIVSTGPRQPSRASSFRWQPAARAHAIRRPGTTDRIRAPQNPPACPALPRLEAPPAQRNSARCPPPHSSLRASRCCRIHALFLGVQKAIPSGLYSDVLHGQGHRPVQLAISAAICARARARAAQDQRDSGFRQDRISISGFRVAMGG